MVVIAGVVAVTGCSSTQVSSNKAKQPMYAGKSKELAEFCKRHYHSASASTIDRERYKKYCNGGAVRVEDHSRTIFGR